MKKFQFIASAALAMSALASCAQVDIPKKASEHFDSHFTNTSHVKWEQEGNEFEVEFHMNGQEHSAKYSSQGEWMETEKELKVKELPEFIAEAIKAKYKDAEIEEAEWVITPDGEFYELEVESNDQTFEVKISKDGQVISSVVSEDHED